MKMSKRAASIMGAVVGLGVGLGLGLGSTAAVAAAPVTWPVGVQKKDDPRLVAFYEAQCTRWADDNGLAGEARTDYLAKCLVNVQKIYPVGYAKSSGGGGE
jgi:hypothetical protein